MSEQKFCYKYPHPSVTADCVIFGFDGVSIKILLIQRGIEPFKDKWAFPGVFVKIICFCKVNNIKYLDMQIYF